MAEVYLQILGSPDPLAGVRLDPVADASIAIAVALPAIAVVGDLLPVDITADPAGPVDRDRQRRARVTGVLAVCLHGRAGLRPVDFRLFRLAVGAAVVVAAEALAGAAAGHRAGRRIESGAAVRAAVRGGVGMDVLGRIPGAFQLHRGRLPGLHDRGD